MKVWLSQKITLLREPSFLLYLAVLFKSLGEIASIGTDESVTNRGRRLVPTTTNPSISSIDNANRTIRSVPISGRGMDCVT